MIETSIAALLLFPLAFDAAEPKAPKAEPKHNLTADEPRRPKSKPEGAPDVVAKSSATDGQCLALTLQKLEIGIERPHAQELSNTAHTLELRPAKPGEAAIERLDTCLASHSTWKSVVSGRRSSRNLAKPSQDCLRSPNFA